MPARRIFCLARTRRWPIASSLERNARATCAVVSPHTVRSVSATCTSAAKEGWQQVKISRSMSSSSTASLSSGGIAALSSNSCVSSLCLPRNAICLRTRSIALLRPTLTSHARGLDGGSAASQRSSATAKASCNASSARSKSPTRRISVASARPASSRNIFSISVRVMRGRYSLIVVPGRLNGSAPSAASMPGPESRDSGFVLRTPRNDARSRSIIDPDRPDLDRARLGAGNARGHGERGIEIPGFDQVVATELLARLRERTIGRQSLAVANPHGGRGRCRLQRVAGLEIAALDDGLGEHTIFFRQFLAGRRVHFGVVSFVLIDQQQILHFANSS